MLLTGKALGGIPAGTKHSFAKWLLAGASLLLFIEACLFAYWFKTQYEADARASLEISRFEAMTFAGYLQNLRRDEVSVANELAVLKLRSPQEADHLLAGHAKGEAAVEGIELADAQGAVLWASDEGETGTNLGQPDYFQTALASGRTIVSDLFLRQGKPVFAVCTPVPKTAQHETWIVVAIVSSERLDEVGQWIPQEEDEALVLFDAQGTEVYCRPCRKLDWQKRHNAETPDLVKRALAGQEAAGTVRPAGENEDQLSARVPVPGSGWVIGTGHPKKRLTGRLVKDVELAGGLDLGGLVLVGALVLAFGRRVSSGAGSLAHRPLLTGEDREATTGRGESAQPRGRYDNVRVEGGIKAIEDMEMLAKFVHESPSPILRIDASQTLAFANRAALPLLHTWNCPVGHAVPPAIGELVSRSLQTGQGSEIEIRCLAGKVFLTTFTPIVEEGYVNVYSRDITQRKRVEEALQESRARLAHLAENVREVFWLGEPEWNHLLYVNKAYEDVWGRSRESLYESPRSWLDAVVEEDKPAVVAALAEDIFGREPKALPEYRIRRPDGTERWILARAWPVYDENDVMTAVAGIAEDVTDRKRAQEAEAKYRILSEDALVGVYMIQAGRIVYANPRLAEIFGYTLEELLAVRSILELAAPEDRAACEEKMLQIQRGQADRLSHNFRGLCKDGRVVELEMLGSVAEYNGRRAFIGSLMDVTARKCTDEALRRTADELARSNRDLEHFAGIVSHDLQEPLRMVTGFLGMLAKSHLGPDESEFISFAVDGAQRMQRMIHDLLAYARLGSKETQFEATSVQEALDQALANLQIRIGEVGAVITHGELPVVQSNLSLLSQVFQNLVGNAMKFHSDRRPEIHIAASRRGNSWVFSVSDNGIGIDPSQRDRIFEIFQRLHTHKAYSGSGVGLAVCKRIVQMHGGDISVESQPGEGSTFYFSIPDRGQA